MAAQTAYTQHRFIHIQPTDRLIPLYPLTRSIAFVGQFRRRIPRIMARGVLLLFLFFSFLLSLWERQQEKYGEPATCIVCFSGNSLFMREACIDVCAHFGLVWSGVVWCVLVWFCLVWSCLVWSDLVWVGYVGMLLGLGLGVAGLRVASIYLSIFAYLRTYMHI